MTHTQALLERLRKICDPPTDYEISKKLGVTPQHVHNWLHRGSGMDLVTAYVLADFLHEDRAIIAGMVELDKKNLSDKKRRQLEHMLPRFVASTSAAVLALLAALTITGKTAEASIDKEGTLSQFGKPMIFQEYTLCALVRRLIRQAVMRFTRRQGALAPWTPAPAVAYAA